MFEKIRVLPQIYAILKCTYIIKINYNTIDNPIKVNESFPCIIAITLAAKVFVLYDLPELLKLNPLILNFI